MRIAVLMALSFSLCAQSGLLLNQSDFARIQKTAAKEPWAAALVEDLVHEAEDWPAAHVREFGLKEWALPTEGAGWSHDYVCPVHGVRLVQKAGRNLCPIDGKDYHGWPVDNVVYMQRNDDNARAARDLGLAYLLTGRIEFAEKARRILNAYSALYPTLPIHDNNNQLNGKRGARVMSQTLSEAKWLVPLAFGYDLVRDAMPQAERERFEAEVLKNAAAVIRRNDMGASNWQSWHNAALLAVAILTHDDEMARQAVDGPSGFRFQLREGITADGPWHEGSWGYHFFALEPLLLTREMAARAGRSAPESEALKRMFDAPLLCVLPDGTLPAFNDSGSTRLASESRYYEIGYRLFHDSRYLHVLQGRRRSLEGLLWGPESLPSGEPVPLTSEVLRSAGIALLRTRASDFTIAVKFGPHGGGHGHFDKLSFVSYANGKHLAVDPGTQAYGAKSHATWDKMTIAHNTVTVDERTQAAATGKLLDWSAGPDVTAIRIAAGPVYAHAEIERTLVLTAGYALDIVDVRSNDGAVHAFDWIYHNFGAFSSGLPLEPYTTLPAANGYQHLTGARGTADSAGWQADFKQPGANLRAHMLGCEGTTVVSGEGLGPDLRVPVPFVMARRAATATRFVALYEPYRDAPSIKAFRQIAPGVFRVATASGAEEIRITPGASPLVHVSRSETTPEFH